MKKSIESETMLFEARIRRDASSSLSKIEVALADWDASRKKPRELGEQIKYLKMSHRLVSDWLKKSIKGKKDFISSFDRLQDFCDLCSRLEKARPG